jgi:hypothetical protein
MIKKVNFYGIILKRYTHLFILHSYKHVVSAAQIKKMLQPLLQTTTFSSYIKQYKQFREIRGKKSTFKSLEIMKSQRKLSKINTIKPTKTPNCAR